MFVDEFFVSVELEDAVPEHSWDTYGPWIQPLAYNWLTCPLHKLREASGKMLTWLGSDNAQQIPIISQKMYYEQQLCICLINALINFKKRTSNTRDKH